MNNWHITEGDFDPERLHHKETVFTIGNGYLSTRGAFEEGYPHARAITLVHGLFDAAPVVHTELVNAPNWLDLVVFIDGERFRMDQGEVYSYRRDLDLRTGVLTREVRWRSLQGHTVDLAFERFASLADEHVMAVCCQVTSVDFEGVIEIRAGLPGYVDNDGLLHWAWIDQGAVNGARHAYLTVETRESHLKLCEACHLDIAGGADVDYVFQDCHFDPTLVARVQIQTGETVTAHKLVTVYQSRDVEDVQSVALDKLAKAVAQGYDALRAASEAAWQAEWEACNITIEGDAEADRALRFNLYELMIAAPRHDDHVSIAAKTLSGLGYRGHTFWDTEIFMLPFFIYTCPDIARNMLLYRYHTLPGARRKAEAGGYDGAMYAWESAATGDETTPRWVPGPQGELVRIWCGDIELHITSDVAYGVHQYWRVTGDDAFMRDYGAEIVLDTARFWESRVEYNVACNLYEISDVIGPDENHEHVDNNAYTNYLVRWHLKLALYVLEWLRRTYPKKDAELRAQLGLTPERLAHWDDVIAKLYVPYDLETRLIEQFEGFFELKRVDLADYEPRATSMQALLGIEEVQAYQIIKQPDVLMLLYLLRDDHDKATIRANWEYYTPCTDLTYGSSLGPAIQAALAARMGDTEAAYVHFMHAARTDIENARGNAGDGAHGATAGGLWQAAVFGFGGLTFDDQGLTANPALPPNWQRLTFRICYQGDTYTFDMRPNHVDIREESL